LICLKIKKKTLKIPPFSVVHRFEKNDGITFNIALHTGGVPYRTTKKAI